MVTYTPDSAGRTISAADSVSNTNYATAATFQADGQMTGFTSGHSATFAGITNSFSYNNRLQPINMSAVSPSQTVFSIGYDFHWQNSDNGNVFAITNYRDATRSQTFSYDALNRLTSAQNAGTNCAVMTVNGKTEYWGNNYGYDAWANLTQKSITKCSAENFSVAALNNNQLTGYGYDAAGNMTHDLTSSLTYSYDAENRINGANGYTYTYDADGNRVEKSNGSTGTLYWYMTPGIVAESDLTGALKSEYVFFNGERVARRDFGPTGPTGVFYYFSDHLKTASVITDASGNIKSDSDYYPWGGELQFIANDPNHYKFTGKERDTETGLDYFGARYYSNGLGRFITPDWAAKPAAVPYVVLGDPQSLNLYSYVRNVPTVNIDTDGHCPDVCPVDGPKSLAELDRQNQVNKDTIIGLGKSVVNFEPALMNTFITMGESANGPIPLLQPSNDTQQIAMTAGSILTTVITAVFGQTEVGANAGESGTSAGAGGRLPQDINANPQAPAANNGQGTVGPSSTQNAAAQADAAAARAAGHTDVRMNQQQVNAQGQRVGVNRPDLQSTDANGVRHYTEYDRSVQNAAAHHARTQANDPNGVTHTKIGP